MLTSPAYAPQSKPHFTSGPTLQRLSLDDVTSTISTAAETLSDAVRAAGSAANSAADAAGQAATSAAAAATQTASGASDTVSAEADAIAEKVRSIAAQVVAVGGRMLSGIAGSPSAGVTFELPDVEIAEIEEDTYTLPIGIPTVTSFEGAIYLGSFVVNGWAGTTLGDPSLTVSVGPVKLQGIRVVLNPFASSYAATGELYIGSAIVGSVEKSNEVILAAAGMLPEPPVPIIGSAEAGTRAVLRVDGKQGITVSVAGGYSGGSFGFKADIDAKVGGLIQLDHEAFMRIEIEGDEICSMFWPLSSHRIGETGIDINVPISVGTGSTGKFLKIGKPTVIPISPDAIPTHLQDDHEPAHCMNLVEISRLLCGKGKLPPAICSAIVPPSPGSPMPISPGLPVAPVSPPIGSAKHAAPTGMSKNDPIEMTWFKRTGDYPTYIWLKSDPDDPRERKRAYRKDLRQPLPSGREWIGVKKWPDLGDVFQRVKTPDRDAKKRFREALEKHGYSWATKKQDKRYEADHVQDLQFAGPDSFVNLWPLEANLNEQAGNRHAQQSVIYSEPTDPPTAPARSEPIFNLPGRFFVIRHIKRPF